MATKYTKDKLIEEFIDMSKRNTEAFERMQSALQKINDTNVLHVSKDDERYETIKQLINSNTKVMRIVHIILILLFITIMALVVLAGAESSLKYIPNLPF